MTHIINKEFLKYMTEAEQCAVERSTVLRTKATIDAIFAEVAENLRRENAIVIMPTFYPQEGGILQELARLGVNTHIYGPGGQIFTNVPHTRVEGVASNVDSETPENVRRIIDSINLEELRGKNLYIYQFMHYEWRALLQQRIDNYNRQNPENPLNCTICADMTMGHEQFFEGKHQLPRILEEAGLSEYIIPGVIRNLVDFRDNPLNEEAIKGVFGIRPSDQTGKIVVQFCGEGYQEVGGGQGTIIFENYEEYAQALRLFKTPNPAEEALLPENSKISKFLTAARANVREGVSLKISKYIEGIEGNLSFIVLPSYIDQEGRTIDIRRRKFRPTEISAQMQGIRLDERRTRVIPGRMTLKCVGDPRLTTKSGSGVGNDLGYAYGEERNRAMAQISIKIGRYMALNGNYGLAGCDAKSTPDGRTYVIEINDRQQGPTASMSIDGEAKGAPSLIKMQTICAFGTTDQNSRMQEALEGQERLIGKIYMSHGGSFYIKFANVNEGAVSPIALRPGYYFVVRGEDGRWHWDLQNSVPETEAKTLIHENNLDSDRIVLGLKGCNFEAGKHFELDEQMAKIVGFSSGHFTAPFGANSDGTRVILQDGFWAEIICDLRNQIGLARHDVEEVAAAPVPHDIEEAPMDDAQYTEETFDDLAIPTVKLRALQLSSISTISAQSKPDLGVGSPVQQSLDFGEHTVRVLSSRGAEQMTQAI